MADFSARDECDSGEDDAEREVVDWDKLGSSLSATALAALKEHLQCSKDNEAVEDYQPDAEEAAGEQSGFKIYKGIGKQKNADFKEQEYWDERFSDEEQYDWLLGFSQLRSVLLPLLEFSDKILILGCGNSSLSADLYDEGFTNITNIDFSSVVIDRMRARNSENRPQMKWDVMDMTDLKYEPSSFDVVIDKASIDALMVDEGDVWDPNNDTIQATDKTCLCVSRILKPQTGRFIAISFAQPHFRTKYLMGEWARAAAGAGTVSPYSASKGYCERYGWTLTYDAIETEGGCLNSFLYVMRKS
jgi:SAM-dependent methyltransferase